MIIRHAIKTAEDWNFVDSDIVPETIKAFGILNHSAKRMDGSFKKFYKTGFVMLENKTYLSDVSPWVIKELKELLKGKYTTVKNSKEQYKQTAHHSGIRKATDWTYTVN